MSCNINAINCISGPHLGGIKALHIIREANVIKVPSCGCDENHMINSPISIPPGQGFISHYFEPNTIGYRFRERSTPNGPVFDCEIVARQQRLRQKVDAEIRKMAGGHFILVSEDYNGQVRLHGRPGNPWLLSTEGQTGEGKGDDNSYRWRFYGVEKNPSCYMDPLQPIPHKEELTEAMVIQIGSNDSAGNFIESAAAETYDPVFLYQRISGQVYEKDGITPAAPAVGKEIEFTIFERALNGVETPMGVVTFDWVNPIIWGDPVPGNNTSPSSDPSAIWDRYKDDIQPGSGIDAAGAITLNFYKLSWAAISTLQDYEDAKEIVIQARVIKSGVRSTPSTSYFPFILRGAESAAMREFFLAVQDADTLRITSLTGLGPNWTQISGWNWEIGDNVFSIPSGGSYANSSPVAGDAGIIDITSNRHDVIDVTYNKLGIPWAHKVRCSMDVQHITGQQKTIFFETYVGTLEFSSGRASFGWISPGWNTMMGTLINENQLFVQLQFATDNPLEGFSEADNKMVFHNGNQVASNLPESAAINFYYFLNKRFTVEEAIAYADLKHSSISPGTLIQASRNVVMKQLIY